VDIEKHENLQLDKVDFSSFETFDKKLRVLYKNDAAEAAKDASDYLYLSNTLNDLILAISIKISKCETIVNSEYSKALIESKGELKKIGADTTEALKKAWAENKIEYSEAKREKNNWGAVLLFLKGKLNIYIKAHQFCHNLFYQDSGLAKFGNRE